LGYPVRYALRFGSVATKKINPRASLSSIKAYRISKQTSGN
jgi:hypothetical protein